MDIWAPFHSLIGHSGYLPGKPSQPVAVFKGHRKAVSYVHCSVQERERYEGGRLCVYVYVCVSLYLPQLVVCVCVCVCVCVQIQFYANGWGVN